MTVYNITKIADANANKVKYIPTELNYINYTSNQIKAIKKHCNTSRLMILALILWNLILTTCLVIPAIKDAQSPIPQFDDATNKQIIIEEGIPVDLPEIPVEELK